MAHTDNRKSILDLDKLAAAVCNPLYKQDGSKEQSKTKSTSVRKYILDRLTAGKILAIKDLRAKYHDIPYSTVYQNFLSAKKELTQSGKVIERVGAGRYCVNSD